MHTHTCTQTHIHTRAQTHIHTQTHTNTDFNKHTLTNFNKHTLTHFNKHTQTHNNTHLNKQTNLVLNLNFQLETDRKWKAWTHCSWKLWGGGKKQRDTSERTSPTCSQAWKKKHGDKHSTVTRVGGWEVCKRRSSLSLDRRAVAVLFIGIWNPSDWQLASLQLTGYFLSLCISRRG